jgi:hypothetical protein
VGTGPFDSGRKISDATRYPRSFLVPPYPVPDHALPLRLRHRAAAALLAISFRSFAVSAFVLAAPPWRAISFRSFVVSAFVRAAAPSRAISALRAAESDCARSSARATAAGFFFAIARELYHRMLTCLRSITKMLYAPPHSLIARACVMGGHRV